MPSNSNDLSTFLSDSEHDGDFALRKSGCKLRRRSTLTTSSDDAGKGLGVAPTVGRAVTDVPEADSKSEVVSKGKALRVEPGEVDCVWPSPVSDRRSETTCETGASVLEQSKDVSANVLRRSSSTTTCNTSVAAGNIQVACRFRPLLSREVANGESECGVRFSRDAQARPIVELDGKVFTMDHIFDSHALQSEVYETVARPIVQDVLEGYNGTVMAYGSTGSGKTYTMEGKTGAVSEYLGIIPRMVSTLFDGIDRAADTFEFSIKVSAVEIYMERIIDLLRKPADMDQVKVRVREDAARGVWVDAVERHAANEADIYEAAHAAQASRRVAATHMNAVSSRSHFILMMRLTALDKQTLCERQGVLYLVDLAGSEKVSQTCSAGLSLEEAKKINRSLSCLGNVIAALTADRERHHVPYRDSKLTRVLQQSLGGNAKTCLIAACSPALSSLSETLTTLRFSERVKNVRNSPKVNEQRSMQQLLRDLTDSAKTIEALKLECASLRRAARAPHRQQQPWLGDGASFGSTPKKLIDDADTELEATSELVDDVIDDLESDGRRALVDMKEELTAVKRERDAAREHLRLLELRMACRPSTIARPSSPTKNADNTGSALQILEDDCEALRFQVASLNESRAARLEAERQLKEEVLTLRDSAVQSSQEIEFLKRERDELRQLLQTCSSGVPEEEKKQWDELLSSEAARREAIREQWRAYLSNRIHKMVQLEIENEVLRDTLTSLQLGLEDSPVLNSQRQPEIAGEDFDETDHMASILSRMQQNSPDGSQPGKYSNVAHPIVPRRRQRSCERQLPTSPRPQYQGPAG